MNSENRRRDEERCRGKGWEEFPVPGQQYRVTSAKTGEHILRGYNRVVYGDHGPYVEFEGGMVMAQLRALDRSKEPHRYYDTFYTACNTKVYWQRRSVGGKSNPPQNGSYYCNNNREEGYADYKVGKWYVAVDEMRLVKL